MVTVEVKSLRDGMKSIELELARCSRVTTRASAQIPVDEVKEQATRALKEYLDEFEAEFQPKLETLQKRLKTVTEITQSLASATRHETH